MSLRHITDTHIGIRGNGAILNALAKIKREMKHGDILAVTGDITDNGLRREYREARKLLDPFKGQVVICKGNHDGAVAGNFHLWGAHRRFKKLQQQLECETKDGFIILDSCKRTLWFGDFARGKIGYWQRQWLKVKLKFAKSPPIVILHHDPLESNWTLRLEDADKLIKICDGKADMVLYGHTHRDFTRVSELGTMFSAADDFDDAGKAKVYEWKS